MALLPLGEVTSGVSVAIDAMSNGPTMTAAELATRLRGELSGAGTIRIHEVTTLELATPQSLSWAANADFLPRAEASKAGVILIPRGCRLSGERTVIHVADPDASVCDALELLAPPIDVPPAGVDPTASVATDAIVDGASIGAHVTVGAGAVIGSGTQIHAGVCVGAQAKLGADCVLWPNAVVRERVTIGDRVVIHLNASIGADGFGYLQRDGRHRKIPQIGTVIIEDDVEIGAGSAIDRARSGVTRVGRGTKIDNHVQIGHNVQIGAHCMIVAQCGIGGSATLGDFVVLGGQVAIVDHCRVGDGVQVAAKSMVTNDIPAGSVVRGNPATDHRRFAREQAAVRKLPEWLKRVRAVIRRVNRQEENES